MQTILGSGGVIGRELAKALIKYTYKIRLVSRTPQKVNSTDSVFPCNLLEESKVSEAVKGSQIAYLTAGLPYDAKVWQSTWPELMKNVIEACKTHRVKLVFFDNVYMYDPNCVSHLTEETRINPLSKKGMVRAQIAQMILNEVEAGNLRALIARSADFYGPDNDKSVLGETVFKNLKNGKKANWLCSVNYKHSFTFTPDAGKATALLGNSAEAYNQVWHLPTAKAPLTGKEWIAAFAKEMNLNPKYRVAGKNMVRLLGLFDPLMKELVEMLYQYDQDYCFDSSKFESHYDLRPTPYLEGIRQIVEKEYDRKDSTK
jgi:nucleoside-diphosphate-sugar epimerase